MGFVFGCTKTVGCKGEFVRPNGQLFFFDVNRGVSQGNHRAEFAFIEVSGSSLQFTGFVDDRVASVRLNADDPPELEDEGHPGFYGRNQRHSANGAFKVHYSHRAVLHSDGSGIIETTNYSFSEVSHPTNGTVRHFTVSGETKGICAVFQGGVCPSE